MSDYYSVKPIAIRCKGEIVGYLVNGDFVKEIKPVRRYNPNLIRPSADRKTITVVFDGRQRIMLNIWSRTLVALRRKALEFMDAQRAVKGRYPTWNEVQHQLVAWRGEYTAAEWPPDGAPSTAVKDVVSNFGKVAESELVGSEVKKIYLSCTDKGIRFEDRQVHFPRLGLAEVEAKRDLRVVLSSKGTRVKGVTLLSGDAPAIWQAIVSFERVSQAQIKDDIVLANRRSQWVYKASKGRFGKNNWMSTEEAESQFDLARAFDKIVRRWDGNDEPTDYFYEEGTIELLEVIINLCKYRYDVPALPVRVVQEHLYKLKPPIFPRERNRRLRRAGVHATYQWIDGESVLSYLDADLTRAWVRYYNLD